MYLLGAALTVVFGLLYFGMLENRVPAPVFLAVMLSLVPHDMMYGPQAALIGEALTPHSRFRGSSVGSQLDSVIAGGGQHCSRGHDARWYRSRYLDGV